MEETIDYGAVIAQLQLENEMLRRSMGFFTEVHEAVFTIPNAIEHLWQKAIQNKTQLLIGLMLLYWSLSIAFMFFDRLRGKA